MTKRKTKYADVAKQITLTHVVEYLFLYGASVEEIAHALDRDRDWAETEIRRAFHLRDGIGQKSR